MGAVVEPGGQSSRAKAKVPRLILGPDHVGIGRDEILVKHVPDGGYFCFGFGAAAEFLRAVDDDETLDELVEDVVDRGVIAGPSALAKSRDPSLRRLARAIALAKDGFNPDQPRDERGRWSGEGGSAAAAAATVGAATADMFGAPTLVPALRQFAAGLLPAGSAGAVAALGVLVIPTNRSLIAEGPVPDEPGLAYHFDQGTGVLTFTRERDDGSKEVIFSGRQIADNVFRDSEGNVIGRDLGGSLIVDPDTISGYRSNATDDTSSQSGAGARSDAAVDRSEPKLCPDPGPDRPGRKTEKDIAYEQYVGMLVNGEPLPYGLAVRLRNPVDGEFVYYDNCNLKIGTMIDAKGTGYVNLRQKKSPIPWLGAEAKMLRQSKRQLEAAQGRPIEWYVAEKEIADHVRDLFARNYRNITIIHAPPPDWPIFKCEFLLDGVAPDELRYFPAMLS